MVRLCSFDSGSIIAAASVDSSLETMLTAALFTESENSAFSVVFLWHYCSLHSCFHSFSDLDKAHS